MITRYGLMYGLLLSTLYGSLICFEVDIENEIELDYKAYRKEYLKEVNTITCAEKFIVKNENPTSAHKIIPISIRPIDTNLRESTKKVDNTKPVVQENKLTDEKQKEQDFSFHQNKPLITHYSLFPKTDSRRVIAVFCIIASVGIVYFIYKY